MMTTNTMTAAAATDAELVAQSLKGDRDAFGLIVARYQSLVCSLAYCATGSLGQSEDLAQETFLAAWQQLCDLREPEKLRSWLCGIARNLSHNSLRRAGREPAHAAESLETIPDSPASEPSPAETTISREEEAILWRSVGQIPEIYREPLVLFYRGRQSIETVAVAMEISEELVKQRLSRGRKLLQEQVAAFVAGALERTNPGKAFTVGVLAALPVFTISAKAATIGATAAKGSAAAQAAAATGLAGAILAPFLSFFGTWVGYRMSVADARTEAERVFIQGFYRRLSACIFGFFVLYVGLIFWAVKSGKTHSRLFTGCVLGLAAGYALAVGILMVWSMKRRRTLVRELAGQNQPPTPAQPVWEYRSDICLLGFPLLHVRIGGGLASQKKPVIAWLAIGDAAVGLLFAFGGLAIAPLSIGGCAIGLVPFGGCALGLASIGGFSVGWWAQGGLAIGWQAFGGMAVAWQAAMGGMAVAHDFALGGIANGLQANNDTANAFCQAQPFFHRAQIILNHSLEMNLIWVLPLLLSWRVMAIHRRRRQNNPATLVR